MEPSFAEISKLTQECYQYVFNCILAHGYKYDDARRMARYRTAIMIARDRVMAYKLMVEFLSTKDAHSRVVKKKLGRMSYSDFRKDVMKLCTKIYTNKEKTVQVIASCLKVLPLYINMSD